MPNADGHAEFFVEVMPEGSLEVLSKQEVERLRHTGAGSQHALLRRCALAVLNWGSETDSAVEMLEKHEDFDLRIVQQDYGVTLALRNAPGRAFVDDHLAVAMCGHAPGVFRSLVAMKSPTSWQLIDSPNRCPNASTIV